MAQAIYFLCTLTSLACAVLLLRGYALSRHRLLFWSGLCFSGITLSNVLLVLDFVVLPATDISTPRLLIALVSMGLLLFGLVWEEK